MGDSVVTTAAVNDIISISDCDSKYFRYVKCFMVRHETGTKSLPVLPNV